MSAKFLAILVAPSLLGCGSFSGNPSADLRRPACVDAAVADRLSTCVAAKTQADCAAAGGAWEVQYPVMVEICRCPTGWGACSCSRSQDCGPTPCSAPLPENGHDCGSVTSGHCEASTPSTDSCWCGFDSKGVAKAYCI